MGTWILFHARKNTLSISLLIRIIVDPSAAHCLTCRVEKVGFVLQNLELPRTL